MEGVSQLFDFPDSITLGEAKLTRYSMDAVRSKWTAARAAVTGYNLYCPEGDYVKLHVNGRLMMSDTQMEKRSNLDFVLHAKGNVFIAGLGIGLILHNIRDKVKNGIVSSITVIEISQDVIDLVSPYYKDLNIKYICSDVMQYKPAKDEKYDTMYFDIWPDICTDNLNDMKKLSYIWRYHKKTADSWIGYWLKDFLLERRKQEKRYETRYY